MTLHSEWGYRFRAGRKHLTRFEGLLPGSQGQNVALTILYVPCLLDSGTQVNLRARGISPCPLFASSTHGLHGPTMFYTPVHTNADPCRPTVKVLDTFHAAPLSFESGLDLSPQPGRPAGPRHTARERERERERERLHLQRGV